MGYRSDVGFTCTPAVHDVIKGVATMMDSFKQLLNDADDLAPSHVREGRYRWESVKYYDGYEEVDTLNRLMDFFDNCGLDTEYGLIRIGESLDDIEHKGCPHDFDLFVNRSLDI